MIISDRILAIMVVVGVVVVPLIILGYALIARCAGERRPGGGSIGFALQELDRLVARPSIEYKIETENRVPAKDDDVGGE